MLVLVLTSATAAPGRGGPGIDRTLPLDTAPGAATGASAITAAEPMAPRLTATTAPLRQDDIDAFMQEVLERREIDWQQLYDYVFSEVEILEMQGDLEAAPLESWRREYTWYVREGYLVRSPFRVDGVEVEAAEREAAEQEWIRQVDEGERGSRIERDSFFDFEFEAGNYYLAGREVFEGNEVVRIEYYPEHLFADEEEDEGEDELDHMFDRTSRVTMLILPGQRQIVKTTFDNVGLDFLPYGWLVRVEDLAASMVMHRPFEGQDVWLPREIRAGAKVTTAEGSLSAVYARTFSDYRQTDVGGRVIFGRPIRR